MNQEKNLRQITPIHSTHKLVFRYVNIMRSSFCVLIHRLIYHYRNLQIHILVPFLLHSQTEKNWIPKEILNQTDENGIVVFLRSMQ